MCGMRTLIKNMAYRAVSLLPAKGAVILMYHSVSENRKLFTVTPDDFARQMRYLHEHGFRITRLKDVMALAPKTPLPPKSVVLTFDDGYEDNYANAFPVLKKYRFPATIFVTTAFIGGGTTRQGAFVDILSEEHIREMARSGLVVFGSHAHHHVKLARLAEEKIEDELATSKKTLEGVIGAPVDTFAHPYGNFDERVQKIVAKHYAIACGVKKGRITSSSDVLLLPRNSIDSEVTLTQFKGIARFGRL